MMTDSTTMQASQRTLLNNLTRELFQTETSAHRHSNREADRLDGTPPAQALRAVAAHAATVLEALPDLARQNDMIVSKGGMMIGELFSQTRDKFADMLIDSERSYRGTLLGMRHGVDVVRLLQEYARSIDNTQLGVFCASWLKTRRPLVQRVDDELQWFAQHPEEAVKTARSLFPRADRDTAESTEGQ